MEQIQTALLSGHRKTTVNGVLIELKPLKRDTQKNKEREAYRVAQEICKLLN